MNCRGRQLQQSRGAAVNLKPGVWLIPGTSDMGAMALWELLSLLLLPLRQTPWPMLQGLYGERNYKFRAVLLLRSSWLESNCFYNETKDHRGNSQKAQRLHKFPMTHSQD